MTSSEAPISAAIAIHSVAKPPAARAKKTAFSPMAKAIFCRITLSARRPMAIASGSYNAWRIR